MTPIANALTARKKQLGLSDRRLAEMVGEDNANTFTRWRTAIHVPADDKVPELAALLDLDEDEVRVLLSRSRTKDGSFWVPHDGDLMQRLDALDGRLVDVERLVAALLQEQQSVPAPPPTPAPSKARSARRAPRAR